MASKTACIRNIKSRENPNDKIFTPLPVALSMIEMCDTKTTIEF